MHTFLCGKRPKIGKAATWQERYLNSYSAGYLARDIAGFKKLRRVKKQNPTALFPPILGRSEIGKAAGLEVSVTDSVEPLRPQNHSSWRDGVYDPHW
jgi:hypothetical protein